ncbi:testis specific protein Y-linked [Corythoichthys intestinalis]|uniref:testis specific protein Y-linked n=1 Tax=Corythoichthys intestinalis TaxID=161448 RepID=UPI0025A4ED7A|nr:testis specific protein Y-linked [Corythoichthys intestinalis]XP_057686110.1 testis specific protein Y-linked [Corythoichthys intestinalis]
MSDLADCKQSADSESMKRCASPDQNEADSIPSKSSKVENSLERRKNGESTEAARQERHSEQEEETESLAGAPTSSVNNSSSAEEAQSSKAPTDAKADGDTSTGPDGSHLVDRSHSDSAAIAAAEALASLTAPDGENSRETPCSSERARHFKRLSKGKERGDQHVLRPHSKTRAAPADSSTFVQGTDRQDTATAGQGDESMSASSSTPSSSFPSENEDNEDGECAIVSVKMAPEMRQSVALLAQVQMRLEALEKKSAWLHQRLELKMGRMRRPHLDQRSSITKTIPGFWVTALLNHPHLSAHIDETDEDALSYMTDLEIETFKNQKVGFRIRFHFRRNPYFQNNTIMKELHLGLGATPRSFSNAILWHRGHNLTAHSEPRKMSRGVYQTFFSWFGDHSDPGQDDVAQILKDDLYRDPLRYYLTPLWQPRENGSDGDGAAAAAAAANRGNGDDCVVISDSDEETGEAERGHSGEEEEEEEEEKREEEGVPSADESQEEGGSGEIVIDGSDDSEQDEEEA